MKIINIILILSLLVFGVACTPNDKPVDLENLKENPTVVFETNMGTFEAELFYIEAPITAGNFLKLVNEDFYDGIIFHRVIDNFMIQGGDPEGRGTGGPGYTIKDEFIEGLVNNRGTLSMANAGPNTGGSQFFINTVNNNYLDGRHAVFGKITKGMEIVDEISKVETGIADKPVKDVVMQKVYIKNN